MKRRIGKNDMMLLLAAAVLVLAIYFFYQFFGKTDGDRVVIYRQSEVFGTYALDKDQTIPVTDPDGRVTNTLTIKRGQAKMTDADCPDGICVSHAPIRNKNESIICLPNQVVISIESEEEGGVDAIAN